MTFILPKYRGYSAAMIKSRASIPDQADMVVNGDNVEYNLVNMTKIMNALGASTLKQTELHNHPNVNLWSGFGPVTRTVSNYVLINCIKNPYGKNEFAGYNHNAVAPGWLNSSPDTSDLWVNNGATAEISVDVKVGEVKWHEVANGIVGVVFALYDGSSLVAYAFRNFNDSSVQDDVTSLIASFTTHVEKTYTGKIWLVDSTDFGPEGFDGSQIVCRLPNTNDFQRTVKIKYASSWVFSDTNDMNLPSPWVQNSAHAMNWTTGVFNIGSIARLTACNVRIRVRLIDWLGNLASSGYIIGDATTYYSYDPMDGIDITGMVDLGQDLQWGYKVYVDFEYSI